MPFSQVGEMSQFLLSAEICPWQLRVFLDALEIFFGVLFSYGSYWRLIEFRGFLIGYGFTWAV